jgi:hypothetical protein
MAWSNGIKTTGLYMKSGEEVFAVYFGHFLN